VPPEVAKLGEDVSRASLGDLGDFAGHGDVTGSARVRGALENFVANSSDARRRLDSELERAAGLLSGLAEGATKLDSSLADSVTVDGPEVTLGLPRPVRP